MASIVTAFVGPRPGCYIMKFCQGATEMIGRFVVAALSVAVLIVAAVSLGLVVALPPLNNAEIMMATGLNRATLLLNSYAAGGIGIGVAVLIVVWEIVMIILRFLNIGLLNIKSKIFLIIDIVVGLVLAVVVMISGILAAYMANEWIKTVYSTVTNSLIALSVFALLDGLLLTLLVTWMIVFVLRKWNEEVIKETAKDVI